MMRSKKTVQGVFTDLAGKKRDASVEVVKSYEDAVRLFGKPKQETLWQRITRLARRILGVKSYPRYDPQKSLADHPSQRIVLHSTQQSFTLVTEGRRIKEFPAFSPWYNFFGRIHLYYILQVLIPREHTLTFMNPYTYNSQELDTMITINAIRRLTSDIPNPDEFQFHSTIAETQPKPSFPHFTLANTLPSIGTLPHHNLKEFTTYLYKLKTSRHPYILEYTPQDIYPVNTEPHRFKSLNEPSKHVIYNEQQYTRRES